MRTLLGWMAAATTRWPGRVLAVLGAVSVALGASASTNEFEVDMTQLGGEESEAAVAMDRLRDDFMDPDAAVQVIVDAGPGRNLLTSDGFAAITAAEQVALRSLGDAVADTPDSQGGRSPVVSLRTTVVGMLVAQSVDPATLDDRRLGTATARTVASDPRAAGLVSDDMDLESGSARAALILVQLDPELTEVQRTTAAERLRDAFAEDAGGELADVEVTVFSTGLFTAGLLDAIRAEVPLLFGLALLVVLGILVAMYRTVFDVVVGFIGLIATVVWTFGIVALLGPGGLGVTGPLTQLSVIVPVLLVGLGIDYSVHLTARFREQRALGQPPQVAADRALHTVGAALILATVATAVGFGSIASAPLQLVADLGVFVAIGVVCAFVIMGLLVPAARVLRDRGGSQSNASAVRELELGRLLVWPTGITVRLPWLGIGVGGMLMAGSLVAATDLRVEFDRDDFVPEGSTVEAVLDHQDVLFGGGVTESTFVLVDGDLTDPAVASAVWHAQQAVADIDGVRAVGGTPQVISALTLVADLAERSAPPPADTQRVDNGASGGSQSAGGEATRGGTPPIGDRALFRQAWTGDGFTDDADLGAAYAALRSAVGDQRVAQLLAADANAAVVQIRTTVGDSGAARIQQQVSAAFAPVTAAGAQVTVTSEPIIIAEMSDELAAFQLRAIALTLAVVLVLLAGNYGFARRRPLLGLVAMIPATVAAALVLATMWALGISFNVLTATLTAIAVGIGVPYGVHVVNRFVEDLGHARVDAAIATTLRSTGGALTGSALTTLGAFVVLAFSGLPPIRSLGLLGGSAITFSLLAAVLVQPGALVVWARRQESRTTLTSPARSTVPEMRHDRPDTSV